MTYTFNGNATDWDVFAELSCKSITCIKIISFQNSNDNYNSLYGHIIELHIGGQRFMKDTYDSENDCVFRKIFNEDTPWVFHHVYHNIKIIVPGNLHMTIELSVIEDIVCTEFQQMCFIRAIPGVLTNIYNKNEIFYNTNIMQYWFGDLSIISHIIVKSTIKIKEIHIGFFHNYDKCAIMHKLSKDDTKQLNYYEYFIPINTTNKYSIIINERICIRRCILLTYETIEDAENADVAMYEYTNIQTRQGSGMFTYCNFRLSGPYTQIYNIGDEIIEYSDAELFSLKVMSQNFTARVNL